METLALINAANGIAFTMRLVRKGDQYGRDNCLTHDKAEPLVEFYDSRYAFDRTPAGTVLGQFTGGRYYAATLLEGSADRGLALSGGGRAWTLDAEAFALARAILRNWIAR
jgi:hypothetical protein